MRSYVHFKTHQKIISVFLVVSFFTIPLTFLTLPKTAEATCAPFANPALPAPTSAPVHLDAFSATNQANQAIQGTLFFKDCVLDGIATLIAKTIIKALTKSIVVWINSGFKGNPSFIQNPSKFFTGIADKVAGNIIEGVAPFLCSPFRLNIQLALALSMTSSMDDEISCTLTDVENNFNDFLGNSGVDASMSWDNWFEITQNPQNNPYGAMMIAQSQMGVSIQTAQGKYEQQLDWGRGFLSFEDCSESTTANSYTNPDNPNDKQIYDVNSQPVYGVQAGNDNCVTRTPGAVIENQLNNTLNSDLRGLEIAQSIDQIVAALVGQLVTQALGGAGGLLGAGGSSSSGNTGGGFNYQSSLGGIGNGTIPDLPITGSCMPSTTKAQAGDIVTWNAYVPDINGNVSYEWFGDENLSSTHKDLPSATITYTSNGVKTASVIVSTSGAFPQRVQIDCMPNVEIANTRTTGETPSIACTVSPNTVSLKDRTPVTWRALVLGGASPFTYNWQGAEDLSGTTSTVTKIYENIGPKMATVSIVGTDGNTFTKECNDVMVNVTQ